MAIVAMGAIEGLASGSGNGKFLFRADGFVFDNLVQDSVASEDVIGTIAA